MNSWSLLRTEVKIFSNWGPLQSSVLTLCLGPLIRQPTFWSLFMWNLWYPVICGHFPYVCWIYSCDETQPFEGPRNGVSFPKLCCGRRRRGERCISVFVAFFLWCISLAPPLRVYEGWPAGEPSGTLGENQGKPGGLMVNGRWFFVFFIQYHLILILIHWSISFHFCPHIVCLSTCWKTGWYLAGTPLLILIIYIYILLNCSPVIPISWNHIVIKNEVEHYHVHHGDSFPIHHEFALVLSPRSHVWPRQCWVWGRWCRAPVWSNYSSLQLSQVGGDCQIWGIKKRGTGHPWPSRGTGAFIAQLDGTGDRLEQCERYIRLLDDRVKRSGSTTIIRESARSPTTIWWTTMLIGWTTRTTPYHITSDDMTVYPCFCFWTTAL